MNDDKHIKLQPVDPKYREHLARNISEVLKREPDPPKADRIISLDNEKLAKFWRKHLGYE